MKKFSLIIAGLATAIIFSAATSNSDLELDAQIQGVWDLEHQTLYQDNLVTDTVFNLNGYRQVKIYSKGKVMWSRYNPADSNDWFGYGSYTIQDGILEERLEYASVEMMKIIDTVQVFRFSLVMGSDTYSQIANDPEGNPELSENYKRIE